MALKEFVSAADEATREANEDEEYPFWLDRGTDKERQLVAFRPGDGQIAVLMADTARHTDVRTKVSGAIDFFQSCFDDDDAAYLRNRLLDRNDDFGMPTVQDIITSLLEEWSGRPSARPSVSTPSRSNASRSSKGRTPASRS
jgi:hypothetical protein